MQRTLTIAIIALVFVGMGIGAYFYFFTGSTRVTVAPEGASFPIAGQEKLGANEITALTPGTRPVAPVTVSGRLVQISQGPVVPGIAVVAIKAVNASSSPEVAVNYIERESGNVFSYLTRAKTLTRINNKTLPGIQSAHWLPSGSTAFVRYLSGGDFSTINTYALAATSTNGFFLPQNLSSISVSSAGILSLASGVNGSAVSLGRVDGTRSSTIFTTPLTALRISFAGKNQYLAFSKPSAMLSGDAFLVDSSGHFSRIAGPRNGLVALASPSGKWVLVSYVEGNVMQMELINTATHSSITLPVATIADKCVWTADDESIYCGIPQNPDASRAYPDDWYQGAVQFSDRIWKIQVAGRYAQLVLDFSQSAEGNLDAEALAIDPAGTVLIFVNKNDDSLWSYTL